MSVIGDVNKALSVTNLIDSSVSDISVAPSSDVTVVPLQWHAATS